MAGIWSTLARLEDAAAALQHGRAQLPDLPLVLGRIAPGGLHLLPLPPPGRRSQ